MTYFHYIPVKNFCQQPGIGKLWKIHCRLYTCSRMDCGWHQLFGKNIINMKRAVFIKKVN